MSDEMPTIADSPDALTPAWLTWALRGAGVLGSEAVDGVSITPVGTGQMSDSLRLTLTFDGPTEAPQTLVAKIPAADPTSRGTAVALRNYEKEVRFYQELAPTLDVRTPAVYHAAIDDSLGSFVLLFEDLAPMTQGDQIEGCSVDEARRAITELTRLHAPRWGDPTLADIPWLAGNVTAEDRSSHTVLPLLWAGFQDRYADRLDAAMRKAGDVYFNNLDGYFAPSELPTVVHLDYRLDNLLFHPDTDEVAVVDWQTYARGRGPSDVAYFVGAGLRTDDRREHEDVLVREYHDRLVDAGVKDYSWDECWTDYRLGSWLGVMMAVGAAMMVERTDRGDEMFLTMLERHAHQTADLGAAALIAE